MSIAIGEYTVKTINYAERRKVAKVFRKRVWESLHGIVCIDCPVDAQLTLSFLTCKSIAMVSSCA
jgi:hypothetical protein